jgi:hypothetical protein
LIQIADMERLPLQADVDGLERVQSHLHTTLLLWLRW